MRRPALTVGRRPLVSCGLWFAMVILGLSVGCGGTSTAMTAPSSTASSATAVVISPAGGNIDINIASCFQAVRETGCTWSLQGVSTSFWNLAAPSEVCFVPTSLGAYTLAATCQDSQGNATRKASVTGTVVRN